MSYANRKLQKKKVIEYAKLVAQGEKKAVAMKKVKPHLAPSSVYRAIYEWEKNPEAVKIIAETFDNCGFKPEHRRSLAQRKITRHLLDDNLSIDDDCKVITIAGKVDGWLGADTQVTVDNRQVNFTIDEQALARLEAIRSQFTNKPMSDNKSYVNKDVNQHNS